MAIIAAAAAFSASCLAARRAALRFVRGAIVGAPTLLGRGRGLIGALSEVIALSPVALEREAEALSACGVGLMAATDDARGTAGREDATEIDACEAGRGGGWASELKASEEDVRERPGSLGAAGPRTEKKV